MNKPLPKVSIVITNYNYAQYLSESIESALNQDYENVEVIVVDDGSTDNSKEVIEKYKDKIVSIFQENKGHIEATNSGFNASTGDIITFADADDYLYPNLCKEAVPLLTDEVAKVHYKLMEIDNDGKDIGPVPSEKIKLSEGKDVYKRVIDGSYVTSLGNIYNKKLISQLFPLPQIKIFEDSNYLNTIPPDAYFNPRVPFCGEVKAINKSLAVYRKHGNNFGASKTPFKSFRKRRRYLMKAKVDTEFLKNEAKKNNLKFNKEVRFISYGNLLLRMISLKIDKDHIFPNDTMMYLLFLAFKNLKYKPQKSFILNIYYVLWAINIAISPRKKLIKKYAGL